MELNDFKDQNKLEKYSFLWSEVRLVLAAVALIAGGTPFLHLILPMRVFYNLSSSILTICAIISGLASVYLIYRWMKSDKKLFGGSDSKDRYAFLISVVSGINLGFVGLVGNNVGMSIFRTYIFWVIAAIAYLWSAYHLYQRWNVSGKKVF